MVSSRKEIRDYCLDATRQLESQIGTLVNDFINLSIDQINSPGWVLRSGGNYNWNFLKRKITFAAVSSQEDYVIDRDVEKIALLRQTTSPKMIKRVPDEKFYKYVPNPTATGNPVWYRVWEREGLSTRLDADDTINAVSSSNSDSGDAELAVSVVGYDTNNILRTDVLTLNGTTEVSGTITFDAGRSIFVSK